MNPNLPVGGSALNLQLGARQALPEGLTQLGLSLSYSRFLDEYRGSAVVDGDTAELDAFVTQLSLRHYFGGGFAADLALPAGTITVEPGQGEPTRRLSGFGDLELGAGYDFAALWGAGGYRPSLTLHAGLGLPTGRQGTLGHEGDTVPPNILAIGYGAYSGSAELRLTQFVSRYFGVSPSASVREPFGASESGVTMGGTYLAGLDALVVPSSWLVIGAGGLLQVRTQSDEQEEGRVVNSGGRAVFATGSASVRASKTVAFGVGGRVPLYTDVNGQQLSETYSIYGTLSVSFGGEGEAEDDHAHGEGDDHDHGGKGDEHAHAGKGDEHAHDQVKNPTKGDVADAAQGGASFELARVLAPHKVTVIDFWADWCHSCKHIDARLRQLAAKHADLAVRRVEVPDFDSAVAEQHLRGENSLPQIWVFDREGKRHATVTSLEALERALGTLLDAPHAH
ncbi:MAG: hypothetical protein HYZ29_23980 [Myxococcales bacterium]|nr:hypothetical protein [Myxococcales bacterium]